MRASVPNYELVTLKTLNELLTRLEGEPGVWKPIAGGTDIMVSFAAGKLKHTKYLNIWNLDELRGIHVDSDAVTLGALTTYSEVLSHPILQKEFPNLVEAAKETGAIAIQNRGTLGGNIVNASPAADSPPALLVYGAQLELVSKRGTRWVDYDGFHTGYKQMIIRADEVLAKIKIPRVKDPHFHYYVKVGTRKSQAISKVCYAAQAYFNKGQFENVRVAINGVAPTVVRAKTLEALFLGKHVGVLKADDVRNAVLKDIFAIDDVRSTAAYRTRVVQNLTELLLGKARKHVGLD